jgi:hypothetical protein
MSTIDERLRGLDIALPGVMPPVEQRKVLSEGQRVSQSHHDSGIRGNPMGECAVDREE